MNILVWTAQVVLALLLVPGGAYKIFMFDELARQLSALPHGAWRALGVVEVVCGLLLVVPGLAGRMPGLTPIAAAVIALEALLLAGVYARYSLALTAANPLPWSVAMAVLAAFVAVGRGTGQAMVTAASR